MTDILAREQAMTSESSNAASQQRFCSNGQNKARLPGNAGTSASVLLAASVNFPNAGALVAAPNRVGEKPVRAISRHRSTRQDNAFDARGSSIDDGDNNNPFSKNT